MLKITWKDERFENDVLKKSGEKELQFYMNWHKRNWHMLDMG